MQFIKRRPSSTENAFIADILQNPQKRLWAIIGGISGVVIIAGAIAHKSIYAFMAYSECRFTGADECVNAKTQESVVSIKTENGSGSGVVIGSRKILTNAHVVENSPTVTIELTDGTQLEGKVIGFAKAGVDLALVEVQGGDNLRSLPIASTDSIQVGETTFASGNPLDRGQTFTKGVVSQKDTRWIQSDSAINPGNSGGALLNRDGKLIGLVTAGYRGAEGIGLAIPPDRIQEFLTAVDRGKIPNTEYIPLPADLKYDPTLLPLDDTPVKAQLTEASNPPLKDGSFFDVYIIEGKANQEVTITCSSLQIDPYLLIFAPDGSKLAEQGANPNQSSRNAVFKGKLPADGTYIIFANSKNAKEVGSYSIRASAKN